MIGWDVAYVEARVLSHYYPDRFPDDDLYYHKYIFRVGIERYGTNALFTVFLPAFVIVLIGLIGQFIPLVNIDVRFNCSAPMLAAAVLFHYALIQQLPATAYLTRADKLMIGVYLSILLGMLSSWWFFVVDESHTDRVFRFGRIVVPIMTVMLMTAACVL